jgi:hypothetical protein
MFGFIVVVAILATSATADFMYRTATDPYDTTRVNLTTTTGGPYTYSQSAHRFSGTAYDGTYIDTTGCCSGQSGSCRNNPSCQCQVSVGPLPQGKYSLGNMMTFKGMPYCYELYPVASNNMCGRSGFLIPVSYTHLTLPTSP